MKRKDSTLLTALGIGFVLLILVAGCEWIIGGPKAAAQAVLDVLSVCGFFFVVWLLGHLFG